MSPINGANNTPLGTRNAASPSPAAQQQQRPPSKATPAIGDSRPATPAQSAAPAVQPPQTQIQPEPEAEESKEPPAPFFYEHLGDEVVEQWDGSGRESVQNIANDADDFTAITLLEELVRSSLDGRLDPTKAGSIVRDMIAHHRSQEKLDVVDLFLNIVSVVNLADHGNPKLLQLVTATNIDPDVMRRELDVDLLKCLPLVRSSFVQMRTRKATNILYRQANFNLLREESEGYAKLVTEYFNTANEAVNNHDISAEDAFQRVTALVGSFDLDVGRVLDITLDISANMLVRAYPFFVKFYRCSSWWPADGLFDDIKYEDEGLSSFPSWLLPGVGQGMSDEEVEQLKQEEKQRREPVKEARDARFWQDANERRMQPFLELGGRKIKDLESVLPLLETAHRREHGPKDKEVNVDRRKRIEEDRKYMKTTGFLPPPGNADAAQLLGFKLRFYGSNARDEKDDLPDNLVYFAALLIKIGFISLRDLYPHLYPADDDMSAEKERMEKEKAEKEAKERPGAGLNALAMAKALPDDSAPSVRNLRAEKERSGGSTPKLEKKEEEVKTELPRPKNQKLALLKALLAIGALPEALYILGRFPWLVDVDFDTKVTPALPNYLHRIAKTMLSKVADSITPMGERTDLQQTKAIVSDNVAQADGTLSRKPAPPPKTTRWFGLEKVDSDSGQQHRHYYPDWDDNIPVCQTVDDVLTLCNTFLGYLGVKVGQDAELLGTLVRIAKHSLMNDFHTANRSRWLDLMRRAIVPSLSLSKHNLGLTQAIYELLKLFPTSTRYDIYAEWYHGKTSRLPDIRAAFDYNKAEVKDVLRRVTNESGKKQARALAKVSLSSPGIPILSMINQLESYSNMIPSLVECTRYFSFLAYDILTWCLINSMGGQGRDRLQGDGMLTSPWLQALSQFAASLFKTYSVINPSPVLQYLAFELRRGNTTDLDVFEQVLNEMAGIRSDIDFNDAQVLAMAGGEHLRAVTVQQLHDKRHTKKDKLARLMKALSDPGLTGPLLIAIAQERKMYPHHDSSKFMPLKVLGSNLDKISKIFMQYLEALKTSLRPEEFQAKIPDVVALIGEFGIEPGVAFTIYRTVILHLIAEHDTSKALDAESRKRTLSQEKHSVDIEMKETGIDVSKVSEAIEEGEASEGNADSPRPNGDLKRLLRPHSSSAVTVNGDAGPWHPVLEPLIRDIPTVSPGLSDRVSIPFFVTFWTLSLQDILVHPASYDAEIKRLRAQVNELTPSSRTSLSAVVLKENDRQKKTLSDLQEKLSDELKGRIGTYQKTRNRLSKSEKDHWFARSMNKMDLDARHLGLLQECFLPRAMLSSLDAHYCFLMLKMLHDNGTPGFSTMILMSQLLKRQQLAAIIFQCTHIEAANFGRFLCEVLKLLQHWHGDKAAYEKEAFGAGKQERLLPGFAKKLDANGKPETHLEFEDFRRLLFNWHTYINGALLSCFESDEFMHIRNGIFVLQAISPVFPAITFMGQKLMEQLTKISEEKTDRTDLKVTAASLLGPVKHREKSWMLPQAFRLSDPAKEGGKAGSRQVSARPETPQPEKGTPKLSAAAPEFKPSEKSLTNGDVRKESIAGPEDGEVEDEKVAKGKDDDVKMNDAPPAKAEEPKLERPSSTAPAKETAQPASRPETPATVPSKPPTTDASRNRSSQPPSRPGHSLPDRPERADMRPPPSKPLPAPPADRGLSRYPGSRPDDRYGRLERPGEARPASRGHSPPRSRPRTPERDPRDPYYSSRGPPRGAHDDRYARDDGWGGSRSREPLPPAPAPGRPSSYDSRGINGSRGPPPSQDRRGEREVMPSSAAHTAPPASSRPPLPTSNSQQAQGSQPSTPHSENPARMALISGDDKRPERDTGRDTPKDARREKDSRDERSQASRSSETSQREQQARADQATEIAPNGPRRSRSTRDLGPQVAPETSYGRLNGPPDAPSGPARVPNGPSGRGGRAISSQQPPPSTSRPTEPPLPSPSTSRPSEPPVPPRGPGARGPAQADRRSSGAPFDRQPSSNSVPTTPAAENGPAVHPDRLRNVGGAPTPIQTNLAANGPRSANSPSTATPTGPRGSNAPSRAPTGPASSTPPTGPQSSFERSRRSGGQLADINATLQGSQGPNGQGVNFRGAAQNRSSAAPVSSSAAGSAQPVQAVASSMEPPPRRSEQPSGRRDGRAEPPRGDLFERVSDSAANAGSRSGGSRPPAESEDRHRSSRDRRPDDLPPQRPPPSSGTDDRRGERRSRDEPPRDSRDSFSSRAPRHDDRAPQRAPPPPESPASYGGGGAPPDYRRGSSDERRSGRGSARPDDYGRGGSGRREEERRVPPPPPPGPAPTPRDEGPGGRKRRHEDGGGSFEDGKRRRSGR